MLTRQILTDAIKELSTCKFFPADPGARESVARLLESLTTEPRKLRWLVDTMCNYVGEWPGPAQLRALYATRYRPEDGIEGAHCAIAGFTPVDSERLELEAHENLKRLELEAPRSGELKRLN